MLARTLRYAAGIADPVVSPTVQKNPNKPDPSLRYRVDTDGADFRGPQDALVTIVLFTEFQCPYCKRINKTLAEVTDKVGSALMKDALPGV